MSKKPSAGGKIQWTKMFRKLSPYTIRKGFRYMKHYGPKEFWIRLHERFEPEEVPYGLWYRAYIPTEETLETQRKQKFDYSPLISIAVPAYQTPVEFLRQMIESLIVQTYSNWEAIVIDNHSTDDTVSIVKSYGDSRIQCYLIHNEGVIAKSRNYGITFAKGDYVCFLDSDDWWKENKLNTCLLYCNLNEEVFIYHQFELYREEQRGLHSNKSQYRELPNSNRVRNLLCNGNTIGTSSVCLSRSILTRYQFNESPLLAGVEDFDLWIRILNNDTVKTFFIDQALGFYYVGNTFSASAKQLTKLRFLIAQYIGCFDKAIRREIIKSWYFQKAVYHYVNFKFPEAIKFFLISATSKSKKIRCISIQAIVKSNFLRIYNILK